MNEQSLTDTAAIQLREAGFVVQRDVELIEGKGRKSSRTRADLVAWAPLGDVPFPYAVIEVKQRLRRDETTAALAQLAAYQNLLGAPEAFLYDGSWHQPEALGGGLLPVSAPSLRAVTDPEPRSHRALSHAVRGELWNLLNSARGRFRPGLEALAATLEQALESASWSESLIAQLLQSEAGRGVVAAAVTEEIDRLDRSGTEHTTPNELNVCIAALLDATDGVVLDPFCGTGSTLRRVAESSGADVQLIGYDVNQSAIHLAEMLNRITGVNVALLVADSLREQQTLHADFVVTDSPIGLRLPQPVMLTDGTTTRDGDCAAVDTCLRFLAPGGRAVIVTSPGLLTREGDCRRLRRRVAGEYSLLGVFRLPSGILAGTAIAPAVLIVERGAPTQTLFAVLEDDWFDQLQPGGALYSAYRAHRNGRAS